MDLKDYREQIDAIDRQLVELFAERMGVAAAIAGYKKEHGLPVLDAAREEQKLREVAQLAPGELREYVRSLYSRIFELSRGYQDSLLNGRQ